MKHISKVHKYLVRQSSARTYNLSNFATLYYYATLLYLNRSEHCTKGLFTSNSDMLNFPVETVK